VLFAPVTADSSALPVAVRYIVCDGLKVGYATGPDHTHGNATAQKSFAGGSVSLDVPRDLRIPELDVAGRSTTPRTVVAVPKAPVYKKRKAEARYINVRTSREVFAM
jgi:hypothetical protein